MSKGGSSAAADRLKEYARSERQDGACSPPHTRSAGTAALDTPKGLDKQAKLTLEQVNTQLLSAITASKHLSHRKDGGDQVGQRAAAP